MKTYTGIAKNKGLVSVIAKNKKTAHSNIVAAGYECNKSSIIVSSVHLDFCHNSIKI